MRDLAHLVFAPRLLGFFLAVMLTLIAADASTKAWVYLLCAGCFCYPFLAHWIYRLGRLTNRFIRYSMSFDAVFVSLLLTANHFDPVISVVLIAFLLLSTSIISGPTGMTCVMLVVFLVSTLLTVGLPGDAVFERNTSIMADTAAGAALVLFLTFVARLVYQETFMLYGLEREASEIQRGLQDESRYLRRYVSPQLATVIRNDPSPELRRRRLTICFTDLSGFTTLMDDLPEHEVTGVLNQYLESMSEIALRYGGTVDKFIGDGLMVFFGDPLSAGAKEDACACVAMAIAMLRYLSDEPANWRTRDLRPALKMRVGIHTGYCAVGNFGSEKRMDYTAIGSAVNIASRLEGAAAPGTALVSWETMKLVGESYRFGAVRDLKLKGIEAPVACAEIIGQRTHLRLGH